MTPSPTLRTGRRRLRVLLWGSTSLVLAACGGDSTGTGIPQVAGATYDLLSAAGSLPNRFEDCDDPLDGTTNAQILDGGLQFGNNGRVIGFYDCVATRDGNPISVRIDFIFGFTQSGAQVLIERFGDDFAPDTAFVDGDMLTVRAQFFRAPGAQQRGVTPLVYERR